MWSHNPKCDCYPLLLEKGIHILLEVIEKQNSSLNNYAWRDEKKYTWSSVMEMLVVTVNY